MYKKSINVLFLGIAVVSSFVIIPLNEGFFMREASATPLTNTLYVGGVGANNYTKIQYAIDNASDGDIIYVYSGIYHENVVVNRRINLIGEDKNTTIIDGSGNDGITVEVNNAVIRGMNIINSSIGIFVGNNINNVTLFNNMLHGNQRGIKLQYANNCKIQNNHIYNNSNSGIWLHRSENNTINLNYVYNNPNDGFYLYYSDNNTMYYNYVYNNSDDGMAIYHSSNDNISSNQIYNNSNNGVRVEYSSNNTLKSNHVYNNKDGAYLSSCTDNTIISNKIYNNSDKGIEIRYSSSNIIHSNYVQDNTNHGVYLYSSSDNLLYNNLFNNTDNVHQTNPNHWNISKTAGTNIIGGPYLGGNYWNDYTGMDINGDKLGDTLVPYGPGDYLPLVRHAAPTVVYIDDDYTPSTPGWQKDHFNVIQDGINAVAYYGIVYVYEGTYQENIIVNKPLNLRGNNSSLTTVQALNNSTHVFYIQADWVNISRLTVQGASANWKASIMLWQSQHCNISDVIVKESFHGIYLYGAENNTIFSVYATQNNYGILLDWHSDNNTVENSNASDNTNYGIILGNSNRNIIANNTVNGNFDGISLWTNCNHNEVENNTVFNNDYIGIYLFSKNCFNTFWNNIVAYNMYGVHFSSHSDNNTIITNYIYNNSDNGLYFYHSNYSSIMDCNIYSNNDRGIYLDSSSNNVVSNSSIYNNYDGIRISHSSNNTISANTIINNNRYGILLEYSSYNSIANNNVSDNHVDGIFPYSSSHTSIINNIANNNRYGIFLEYSDDNTVSGNDIINNSNGMRLMEADNNIITQNTITHNIYGIYADPSNNNLIYDNYFNNTINAWDDGNNRWNTTKTAGTNIIGGPYLGGNYWSDYDGKDNDGDELGDTLLPYNVQGNISNGGDYLPLVFPSNHPPIKPSLAGPSSGYTGSSLTFSASSTDPDGDKIRYGFDWNNDGSVDAWTSLHASGSSASKSHSWSSAGSYFIKVIAEDEYGLQSEWSDVKAVTITQYIPPPPQNEIPTVAITSPSKGTAVSGIVTIHGAAGDNDGTVQRVQVKINNGEWHNASGTTSWSYSWDTTSVTNGQYNISARSYDGTDYSNVVSVTVKVANNHKPSVTILQPANGSVVNGSIVLWGTAEDIDGNETLQKVEVRIDSGAWQEANNTTNFSFSLDTKKLENGEHTLSVKAYDGKEYSDVISIIIMVKNEKEGGGTPGFELILLMGAMVLIMGMHSIRKKRL